MRNGGIDTERPILLSSNKYTQDPLADIPYIFFANQFFFGFSSLEIPQHGRHENERRFHLIQQT